MTVHADDAFMTNGQLTELESHSYYEAEGRPSKVERYMRLRLIPVSHDDAMLVLSEDVSVTDCQRLRKAGGSMQEISDLALTHMNAFEAEGGEVVKKEPGDTIDRYIELRCEKSIKAPEAFSRACEAHGIDEKYSEAKRRQRETSTTL